MQVNTQFRGKELLSKCDDKGRNYNEDGCLESENTSSS